MPETVREEAGRGRDEAGHGGPGGPGGAPVCSLDPFADGFLRDPFAFHTELGISYWTKNYRTAVESGDPMALSREYPYYDPIYLLLESGQQWWRAQAADAAPAGVGEPVSAVAG